MATSPLLGGERAATQAKGRDVDALGPSDSSDSGSDSIGELGPDQIDSDTDRNGTGERASADLRDSGRGLDILPDHLDRASMGSTEDIDPDIEQLMLDDDSEDDSPTGERSSPA